MRVMSDLDGSHNLPFELLGIGRRHIILDPLNGNLPAPPLSFKNFRRMPKPNLAKKPQTIKLNKILFSILLNLLNNKALQINKAIILHGSCPKLSLGNLNFLLNVYEVCF
jgi:hypothetical protein